MALSAGALVISTALPSGPPAAAQGACQTASFLAAPAFAVGTRPQSVAVGDFNGDGKLDLAVANSGSDTVSVLLNTCGAAFQRRSSSSPRPPPRAAA